MKHPLLLALAAAALILVAAFAAPLWHLMTGAPGLTERSEGLPWQTTTQTDGTLQVFGLRLGRDTLADAERLLGDNLQVALVARLDEAGALEALADPFSAGFVSGRLVLAFEVPADRLKRWRERAPKSEPMQGGARRFALRAEDLDDARSAKIAGLSFVPSARLSEADVRQRFGPPATVSTIGADTTTLHYPERGLAATVGAASRGVLQYVAPRDYDTRLRAPAADPAASR